MLFYVIDAERLHAARHAPLRPPATMKMVSYQEYQEAANALRHYVILCRRDTLPRRMARYADAFALPRRDA